MKYFSFFFGLSFFFLSAFLLTNCEKEPVDTDINSAQSCEVNHTATVRFENKSQTGKTYKISFDGSTVATLNPGESSERMVVNSGSHTLVFKIANTGQNACNPSYPNLAQCSAHVYSCTE